MLFFGVGYVNKLNIAPYTETLEASVDMAYTYQTLTYKSAKVANGGLVETMNTIEVEDTQSTEGYIALHEDYNTRVDAQGVYIDGEYIGIVSDAQIVKDLMTLATSGVTDKDDYTSIRLSHDITFSDVQIEEELIDNDNVIAHLNGYEDETIYYEVKPGDSISAVGEKYGKSLEEVYTYPWIWNGEVVDNIPENFRVGLLVLVPTDKPYLRPILTKEEVKYSEVPYETNTLYDDTVDEDIIEVITEGKYGIKEVVTRNVYDNGMIIDTDVISETAIAEPITEVLIVGTKPTVKMADGDGGNGTYFYPIISDKGYISAYMGDGRGHKGLDIAAPRGTEIYSAYDGEVTKINYSGWGGGYGIYVYVTNDDGNECMYAHMCYTALDLKLGDKVKQGQLLGYVGSTGDSTGNHLHFEVRTNTGVFKNPLNYVKEPD